jgi:hypothetical protein
MHLGLLHLGQFNPKKDKKRNEMHAPGATAPGAIQTQEGTDMRSMHLGLLHLRQLNPKNVKKSNETHAPGATAPRAMQTQERREKK